MGKLFTPSEVDGMDYETFISTFGNVIEHCSIFAGAIWEERPFGGIKGIHTAFSKFVDELPSRGKAGILRSHPDLAGRLAQQGLLTSESTKEQKSAGLDTLTEEERQRLVSLNERYRTKFGFPFVICARENKKEAILKGLALRVQHSPEVERATGVEEVKKIAWYRLLDIVQE